jgi:alpha-N-arabinofuranosidase
MTFKTLLVTCLLLVTLTRAAETASVVFHSFTYTGRDTIFEQPLPPGHYRNPILAGYYPDPSICRVGDDYYLVNSTFGYFPGIPIFHSRDLVNWTQLGHVIDRPTQLKYNGLGVTRGIFAPSLKYHDGIFYLTCTMVDSGGNFFVTATNPAGPWSDPVWLDFEGIDCTLFFDDDGRAWMINNGSPPGPPLYQGHRAIWIQEFNLAAKKLKGSRKLILNGGVDLAKKPVWIEGPHIFKRNDWYYLCCAEGGTSLEHSQVVLRSKSVMGPFIPWEKNPILTQRDLDGTAPHAVTCTGHAELIVGPDGNWWSAFLGCRPFAGQYWTTGRETFLLPVKWTDDGWPVILPPGERVPYVVASPQVKHVDPNALGAASLGRANPPGEPSSSTSLTGNFTWRDDFAKPALDFTWFMLRTPIENWWSLSKDGLAIVPRADRLSDKGNPSFLARRVQHAKFDASTKLDVPGTAGTSAGLAVFQNETHHYYFAVQRTAEGLSVFVEKWNGPKAERIATVALPEMKELDLRISGDEKVLSFAFALKPGEWKVVGPDADALAITVQAAGGGNHFTGAVIGPHARLESQ